MSEPEFTIIGKIRNPQRIATGRSIRVLQRLYKMYGKGKWRKMKGVATVCFMGRNREAEVHWYELKGIGKKGLKIKRFL